LAGAALAFLATALASSCLKALVLLRGVAFLGVAFFALATWEGTRSQQQVQRGWGRNPNPEGSREHLGRGLGGLGGEAGMHSLAPGGDTGGDTHGGGALGGRLGHL
jgi:hypothetical protein